MNADALRLFTIYLLSYKIFYKLILITKLITLQVRLYAPKY